MSEPKFKPISGQIDFSKARYCPVINTVVTKDGKILLVHRSPTMRLYPNYWNGVSGFLDDSRSIEEKLKDELYEELGVAGKDVASIKIGRVLLQDAKEYKKTWLVVPVLAIITINTFTLDWEAQQAKWFKPEEVKKLNLLPGFNEVISQFFPQIYQ